MHFHNPSSFGSFPHPNLRSLLGFSLMDSCLSSPLSFFGGFAPKAFVPTLMWFLLRVRGSLHIRFCGK